MGSGLQPIQDLQPKWDCASAKLNECGGSGVCGASDSWGGSLCTLVEI